jgi:hypothetical protein
MLVGTSVCPFKIYRRIGILLDALVLKDGIPEVVTEPRK